MSERALRPPKKEPHPVGKVLYQGRPLTLLRSEYAMTNRAACMAILDRAPMNISFGLSKRQWQMFKRPFNSDEFLLLPQQPGLAKVVSPYAVKTSIIEALKKSRAIRPLHQSVGLGEWGTAMIWTFTGQEDILLV